MARIDTSGAVIEDCSRWPQRYRIEVAVFNWFCRGMLGFFSFYTIKDYTYAQLLMPLYYLSLSASSDPVLGSLNYRLPFLQRVVDQMLDNGWIAKSTYFLLRHKQRACCRAVFSVSYPRLSCSQLLMDSLTGLSIPVRFLGCCWHRSGPRPDRRQWSGRRRLLLTIHV